MSALLSIFAALSIVAPKAGETVRERVEAYVGSCGVTAEGIAAFREIMLK